MNAEQYKKERELLYDKAFKLKQLAIRGEGGEQETARLFYNRFVFDNDLDEKIIQDIEKYKAIKPKKTFVFDDMEFLSFEEFKSWFELNKDSLGFVQRIKLIKQVLFKKQ